MLRDNLGMFVLRSNLQIVLGLVLWTSNVQGIQETSDSPLERLRTIAHEGDSAAQVKLGAIYFNGEMGVEKNYTEAVYWFSQAAKQNLPAAQYQLARCYETGLGVIQDKEHALVLYRSAGDQGLDEAQLKTGLILKSLQKNDTAAKYFRMAAQQGHVVAQREWANMLIHGAGVKQAPQKAITILEQIAEKGDNDARLMLAECFSGTIPGIVPNPEKMIEYLWEAASQGSIEGQSKLGYCYEEGIAVAKDTKLAVTWYRKAAEKNYPQALVNLGHCYATGRGVPMDEKKAFQLYKQAADLNFTIGLYNVGVCYAKGLGVGMDAIKAEVNLLNAAQREDVNAEYSLGVLYERGLGVITPDPEKAEYWYQKAADRKDTRAQRALTFLSLRTASSNDEKTKNRPTGIVDTGHNQHREN